VAMPCPDRTGLIDALAGDLSSELEAHLSHCSRCAKRRAAVQHLSARLEAELAALPAASDDRCPDAETLLACAEGSLRRVEGRRVQRHFVACEACLLWVGRVRLALAKNAEQPADPGWLVRVRARLASTRERSTAGPHLWPRLGYALATAATLVVIGVLGPRLVGRHGERPRGGDGPRQIATGPVPTGGVVVRGVRSAAVAAFEELVFQYQLAGEEQATDLPLPTREWLTLTDEDSYRIRFRTREDGWVYVFQVDSSGSLSQLFPNRDYGTAENPSSAGREYWVPSETMSLRLDKVVGEETVYVIFSRERRNRWEEAAREAETAPETGRAAQLRDELGRSSTQGEPSSKGVACVAFGFMHGSAE